MLSTDLIIPERIFETTSPKVPRVFDRHGEINVLTGKVDVAFLDSPDGYMGILVQEGWFAVEGTAPASRDIMKLRSRWRRRFAPGRRLVVFDVPRGCFFEALIEKYDPLSLFSPAGAAYLTTGFYCDFRSDGAAWTLPPRLLPRLPMIAAFELDLEARPIYRDWCQDHWEERLKHL